MTDSGLYETTTMGVTPCIALFLLLVLLLVMVVVVVLSSLASSWLLHVGCAVVGVLMLALVV